MRQKRVKPLDRKLGRKFLHVLLDLKALDPWVVPAPAGMRQLLARNGVP